MALYYHKSNYLSLTTILTHRGVDIVFLLALNFEDIQSTRAFFSSFYEMTMEKNTTFLIRKAETEEEIMNVIMNSMNETEE